jgi:hypothetical protein
MDIHYTTHHPINLVNVLRQAGYHPIHDYHAQHDSWVRLLGRYHYPRFHLYIKASNQQISLSLHIDQKQSTIRFARGPRHAGEYDSPAVAAEAARLQRWLDYSQQV